MKPSTKDKIKGKVKEGLGKLTENHDLEEEGKDDELKDAAWKNVGEIKTGLTNIFLLLLGVLAWISLSVVFHAAQVFRE